MAEADGTLGDSSSRREGEECRKEEASHTLSVRDFAPFWDTSFGGGQGLLTKATRPIGSTFLI